MRFLDERLTGQIEFRVKVAASFIELPISVQGITIAVVDLEAVASRVGANGGQLGSVRVEKLNEGICRKLVAMNLNGLSDR